MPIYNGGGGVAGIQVESDPSALKLANNLSDLPNLATARSNLQLSTYYSAVGHNHNGTYAPVSHSHAISDVTNLQTTLNGKASSTHTHDVTDVTGWGSVNGASNNYVLGWNGSSIVWVAQSGGIADAPSDGSKYARQNGSWATVTDGQNGTNGTNGTDGSMLFDFKGYWNYGTPYAVDDAVSSQGSTFVCVVANDGTATPTLNNTDWVVLAQKGADGQNGTNGTNGTNGQDGAVTTSQVLNEALASISTGSGVQVADSSGSKVLVGADYQPKVNNDYTGPYAAQNGGWVTLPITSASSGSNASGYSNGNFDTTHYPSELALTINGTTYYVPART